MDVLFDTSVLTPALAREHPRHAEAAPHLEAALVGEVRLVVSTHVLAELFSSLTRLPVSPRIPVALARRLIRENVEDHAEVVTLTAQDYAAVLDRMVELDLAGAVIYDALHVQAGRTAQVDRIWTFNTKDFVRVWPDHGGVIEEPGASGLS